MKVDIYWLENNEVGQLGLMARPRGNDWLEDEIISLHNQNVDVLVSLLTSEEIEELGLIEESHWCKVYNILYLSFAILDRNVPLLNQETIDFIKYVANLQQKGKNIVVHCRQGVGRSSLLAASILVLHNTNVKDAFIHISKARKCQVPDTEEQRNWVEGFAQVYSVNRAI